MARLLHDEDDDVLFEVLTAGGDDWLVSTATALKGLCTSAELVEVKGVVTPARVDGFDFVAFSWSHKNNNNVTNAYPTAAGTQQVATQFHK